MINPHSIPTQKIPITLKQILLCFYIIFLTIFIFSHYCPAIKQVLSLFSLCFQPVKLFSFSHFLLLSSLCSNIQLILNLLIYKPLFHVCKSVSFHLPFLHKWLTSSTKIPELLYLFLNLYSKSPYNFIIVNS